ncbi:nicotinamide-nucleotide amidohydrolase family protein [Romboutsia sp.]|uniref:nicotinamide-nucleotide amidohydrolase family protein n=1 Tax=Romboutsia sp. TaxID=1965302 RepID=UPI002F41A0A3
MKEDLIKPTFEKIKDRVEQFVYGEGETSIEEKVAKILVDKSMTISVSESCTGGLVSAHLINYPGISSVFMEGCVTYSNESKISRLGVKKETLDKYGAVSKETAKEMAEGIAKNFKTNVGLSTTGIAGPQGGSDEKPVGLVYVGIHINGETTVKKFLFNGNRQEIRLKTTKNLLNELRLKLLEL